MANAVTFPAAFDLDPIIDALCEEASTWLEMVAVCAHQMGVTVAEGIEALRPKLFTGYYPAEARKATRASYYREGIRRAPARETVADRVARECVAWGHGS